MEPHDLAHARSNTARRIVAALLVATALGVCGATAAPAGAATPQGDRCFVRSSFQVFLGRNASDGEISQWTSRISSDQARSVLPKQLAGSDEWLGVEVTKLYRAALDRDPDASGKAYWIDELGRGVLVNRVGSQVYGSAEFYAGAGSTPTGFVNDIYRRILGRTADAAGRSYWLGQVGQDGEGRGRVAAQFFASVESRTTRVRALYTQILGSSAESPGLEYWVAKLVRENDVRLAVQLASADEFYVRHASCETPGPLSFGQTVYGSIATAGQANTYTLAATAGDRLSINRMSGASGLDMRLVAPNGSVIWNNVQFANAFVDLPSTGTYQLTVSIPGPGTSAYSFVVTNQRNPQSFNVSFGTTISDGVPLPGMGNLERPGASDRYRFNASSGDRLSINRMSGASGLDMRLVAPNGSVIWNNVQFANAFVDLPSTGTYQLTVSTPSPGTGTYGFALLRA